MDKLILKQNKKNNNFNFRKTKIFLFFIHGFCSGSEGWEKQLNFFKTSFTVFAPTLRGHDGKNKFNLPMSIEQITTDCENILNKHMEKKFVFIGHSMGTRVAINLANRFQNNTLGLVLVDGSKFSDSKSYGEVLNNFEKSIRDSDYSSTLKHIFGSMFFSKKFENEKNKIIKRAINVPPNFSLPLRRNVIWFDAHCLEGILHEINLPILILQSTKLDKERNRAPIKGNEKVNFIEFIRSNSSKVETKIFRNTGHYISIEKPKLINKIIFEWVKKIIG